MNYSQKSTLKKYLSKTAWVILFALNCSILLYMICHICKIWTNQNFDLIKTFLIFDNEEEFKNLISAKHQLWTALTAETVLLVLGGFFTYDFLIRAKNFRLNIIASFVLFFCIFTGESLLLFFPAPDKAIEIQTCESIPLKNCSSKDKNCTPKYITWNKENHYCNLIELERQRMIKFLEQKSIEKHQALLEQKRYVKERAKLLAKRNAIIAAGKEDNSKNEKTAPVITKKAKQDSNSESQVAPTPVFSNDNKDDNSVPANDHVVTAESPINSQEQVPEKQDKNISQQNEIDTQVKQEPSTKENTLDENVASEKAKTIKKKRKTKIVKQNVPAQQEPSEKTNSKKEKSVEKAPTETETLSAPMPLLINN